jgi:hypothetical protein
MPPRFTIGYLMGIVSLVGIGLAALHSPSLLWASGLFSLAVLLFSTAVIGAIAIAGLSRFACMGFSAFGGPYLLATFWLWPVANAVTAPPLLSTLVLDYFKPKASTASILLYDTVQRGESYPERPPTFSPAPTPFTGRAVNLLHYRRIGHSLTAIFLGFMGALLGRFLATRRVAATTDPPSTPA